MSNQAQFKSFKAGADFLGNGAIEVPLFESEIYDLIRRNSVALQRFKHVRATSDPHNYFEETSIGTAQFDNKRSLAPTPTNISRVTRSVTIKALDNQTNITLYDKELTQQQGQFASVVAKDIEDTANAVIRLSARAIWNGSDTNLVTPTSTEYVGLLNQITLQSTIGVGASIIDGLKSQVAAMFANPDYDVMPTCIYVNPILGDFLDREAKAANITFGSLEVVAGVKVRTIETQAGSLPIVSDPFIPSDTTAKYGFNAPGAGNSNYYAFILTEPAVEMPYVCGEQDDWKPRLFQLGLQAGLDGQYVAVKFDAIVAKGANYSHATVAVTRPTVS